MRDEESRIALLPAVAPHFFSFLLATASHSCLPLCLQYTPPAGIHLFILVFSSRAVRYLATLLSALLFLLALASAGHLVSDCTLRLRTRTYCEVLSHHFAAARPPHLAFLKLLWHACIDCEPNKLLLKLVNVLARSFASAILNLKLAAVMAKFILLFLVLLLAVLRDSCMVGGVTVANTEGQILFKSRSRGTGSTLPVPMPLVAREPVLVNSEGQALLKFRASITADQFGVFGNWNGSNEYPCNWTGVSCDDQANVTSLILEELQLEGSMDKELSLLTHLQTLSLAGNRISGSIPSELGQLRELRRLDLSRNAFTGYLSGTLMWCKRLEYLDVSRNMLSGYITSGAAFPPAISHLNLSHNRFYGRLPVWDRGYLDCSSMVTYDLSSNNLGDDLPQDFGLCKQVPTGYAQQGRIQNSLLHL